MSVTYLTDDKSILGKSRITAHKTTVTPTSPVISMYGAKIPTRHMVQIDGCPLWRRVYVVCYSNSGSAYVLVNGEALYLSIDCEAKLER